MTLDKFDEKLEVTKTCKFHSLSYDEILYPFNLEIDEFLDAMALHLSKVFKVKLVTIWDNNFINNTLVLLASYPKRSRCYGSFSISSKRSLTGLVIERENVVFHSKLLGSVEGRSFENPKIIDQLELKSMLSVPVFSLKSKKKIVGLVLNICFDTENVKELYICRQCLERITTSIQIYLDYIIFEKSDRIRETISKVASKSTGIFGLMEVVTKLMKTYIDFEHLTLFKLASKQNFLIKEMSTDVNIPIVIELSTKKVSKSENRFEIHRKIQSKCIDRGEPFVFQETVNNDNPKSTEVKCSYMAVPLKSSEQKAFCILECKKSHNNHKYDSFSSIDVRLLEIFSQSIEPHIERFLRLRKGSSLLKVVKDFSNSIAHSYNLKDILQNTMETLVNSFNVEVGSIYLFEKNQDEMMMCAAAGRNQHLIGISTYKRGEGLTGEVANGKILSFKNKRDLRSHPKYKGKYVKEIWGGDSNSECNTFLGIPIQVQNRILGVLKMANIKPSKEHQEPYFTDEDIQIAKVLSLFLGYAIESHKRASQFIHLAQSTINIENTNSEFDAIMSVMIAIEEAGIKNALFSLYDSKSSKIKGHIASGKNWKNMHKKINIPLHSTDILSQVLLKNKAEFIPDSEKFKRFDSRIVKLFDLKAQYIIPLKVKDEFIGILQVDMGEEKYISSDVRLILDACANHLAIAISRARSIKKSIEMSDKIMSSSRFIVAETLSSLAVHSTKTKLIEILDEIEDDLGKKEHRGNSVVKKHLETWKKRLSELKDDLTKALGIVKARNPVEISQIISVEPLIQKSIDMWINYIQQHKCHIKLVLESKNNLCEITQPEFQEIMSVLIVNSIQAHAKNIEIRTFNCKDIKIHSGYTISNSFCIEFEDDGHGLSTNNVEEIFDATYSTKSDKFGTGLGLFIARRIAKYRGGNIQVIPKNTSKQSGVNFLIVLPLISTREE
jgi:signal transduction histidine kinase